MTNFLVVVLIFSVLFQLSAAILAFRLISLTGKTFSWVLISTALLLMSIRRIIPLYHIFSNLRYPVDFLNEIIGLILSMLMFFGILEIRSIFLERKQAEEEIKQKNQELSKLNAEKDKFFSIVAHDLRSPFNSFLGFTRLMVERLPSLSLDETKKMAEKMKVSADNLYDLTENLLEWSMLHRGIRIPEPSSFLLLDSILPILELSGEACEKKMISSAYDIPTGLMVRADPQMVACIMRNLVFNAIKYTPKGGEFFIAANQKSDSLVEISVRDTGIGMHREMTENLFHLDKQTRRKGTEGERGTGLGLIICRELIEKNDGKIWVESEEGSGSVFYFTLPSP